MMKILFFLGLFLLVLVGGWYRGQKFVNDAQTSTPETTTKDVTLDLSNVLPTTQSLILEWKPLKDGIQTKHLPYKFNDSEYGVQVIQIDPAKVKMSLEYNAVGKTVGQWGLEYPNAIVTNAGFFKEKNQPVGLLYINSQRLDAHRISQKSTGLLILEPNKVSIRDLGLQPVDGAETFSNALQSYPMLLGDAQIKVLPQATSQDRRTAIGVDSQGLVYLITAEYAHLGLFDFAKLLKESDIAFTQVLNLDGGGSTGVANPYNSEKNLINSQTTVPTVLMITP